FSPDGKFIASGSGDKTVKVWDVQTGALLRTLAGHSSSVYSVSFSPDGKFIASGSGDKTVKVWDVQTGALLRTLAGHSSYVTSVSFSPDGKFIASGSGDNTVKVWDVQTGALLRTLAGHSSSVYSVSFSPDGKFIASGSWDSTFRIWDINKNESIYVTALLPGNEWITFNEKKLVYHSSLQGDEYMAVRFDNNSFPVYPLKYYRKELKTEQNNIFSAFNAVQPTIEPKRFKLWRDTSRNKWKWGIFVFPFILLPSIYVYLLSRRSDPIVVAREFFSKADFIKITNINKELYLLYKQNIQSTVMASLWKDGKIIGMKHIGEAIKDKVKERLKIYLIYKEDKHNVNEGVKELRNKYGMAMDIIPLYSSILEKSIESPKCKEDLLRLEEPYTIRTDPYIERTPISDPVWFYGRAQNIENLTRMISQGQHVCLCGLRKVGKTSLVNQLLQHFVKAPIVFIDCQTKTDMAESYFREILIQLHNKLNAHHIKKLPVIPTELNKDTFENIFLHFVDKWEKVRQNEKVIIFFDEIDKLFKDRRQTGSENALVEYVKLFSVLRGLAQTRRSLTTVVATYRPDINRQNILMETIGENPMYNSFYEEFLGYFNLDDTVTMIKEIGLWKDIHWDEGGPQIIFEYTGGDPLVSRIFASFASDKGKIKEITIKRVEETCSMLLETFSENDIGNHYKESVWNQMKPDEQELVKRIISSGDEGYPEGNTPKELLEAKANLKRFTLVNSEENRLFFRAKFFEQWYKWRF
ncbi:MAG: AAA family ATPase, partial [Nitrospirae bacterium]|nr:AAA family ATPase [Nitrospirota bacterium]